MIQVQKLSKMSCPTKVLITFHAGRVPQICSQDSLFKAELALSQAIIIIPVSLRHQNDGG